MKFNLHISRRALRMWARQPRWPYQIAWKRRSLRDLFRRRVRTKHGMRERRKVAS